MEAETGGGGTDSSNPGQENIEQPAEPEGAYFAREDETLASEAKLSEIDFPGKDEIESGIESGKESLEEELENKKDQIHDIIHNDPIRFEKDGNYSQ